VSNETSEWLSIPEIAELLGVRQREIRNMLADNRLLAVRRGENNALMIPRGELTEKEGEITVLASLRGTVTALRDAGYSDDEAMNWLNRVDDELGETPLEALRSSRVKAVRRVIAALAF